VVGFHQRLLWSNHETLLCSCFKKGLKNEELLLAICNCFLEKIIQELGNFAMTSLWLGIGHGVVAEWLRRDRRELATSAGAAAHL